MHTHNETLVRAPLEPCLQAAADVERWPDILPHYREVRFRRRDGPGRGRVYMAAYRHFGPVPYPVWWESEMVTDFEAATVHYRHVDGITTGMEVIWRLEDVDGPAGAGTRIVIIHEWDGPGWPLIGGFAARRVIGPRFIHVVAGRTLAGIRRAVEEKVGAGEPAAGEAGSGEPAAGEASAGPSGPGADEPREEDPDRG